MRCGIRLGQAALALAAILLCGGAQRPAWAAEVGEGQVEALSARWTAFHHDGGGFAARPLEPEASAASRVQPPAVLPAVLAANLPPSWDVRGVAQGDLMERGEPQWVLLVWRPWRDWPVMRWSAARSPIADFKDGGGDSAHLVLLAPAAAEGSSTEVAGGAHRIAWASSALGEPFTAIAAADVDEDGLVELVALESDYAGGRDGPARCVTVWRWDSFGVALEWRGEPGLYDKLGVADLDGDGDLEILVRSAAV